MKELFNMTPPEPVIKALATAHWNRLKSGGTLRLELLSEATRAKIKELAEQDVAGGIITKAQCAELLGEEYPE